MTTTQEMTPYLASAIVEGFCEGENATLDEQIIAWAYLISTGLAWQLQGWYGRNAEHLIRSGYIDRDGNIDWELIYSHI